MIDPGGPPMEDAPGIARQAHTERVGDEFDQHAYDVAVASNEAAVLVTWSQNRAHPGDPTPSPDVIAQPMHDAAGAIDLTPYATAQVAARPIPATDGFVLLWQDNATSAGPTRGEAMVRRALVQRVDRMPLASESGAIETTSTGTQQDSATAAVLGDRAFVVYDAADAPRDRASVIDLATGTIVAELELPPTRAGALRSVTAGSATFLVLHPEGAEGEEQTLFATLFDRDGFPVWGPTALGNRYPDSTGRLQAGFHGGQYFVPVIEGRDVVVDRACCPFCAIVQPPTCEIREYDTYIAMLDEESQWIDDAWCLDCRLDVGATVPSVVSKAEGVYFRWGDIVARAGVGERPDPTQWRRIEFDDAFSISRTLTDFTVWQGHIAIVGRSSDLAAVDSPVLPFVAWAEF